MTAPTVHLVDASPYIFRAFHALPEMEDAEGRPVHAVYGFLGFLIKLVNDEDPTHLAVTFDKSLVTSFRNDIYAEYKASRALPPPDLEAQLGACEEIAAAFGAATFVDDRYEADDLIATLLARLDCGAVIVTSDKDLAQLVTDRVTLFDFARKHRYGPAEVREKFGVRPEQIADFLGLAGDSVDNIPGVKGVGKKTAAALLAEFGSVEGIYERLDDMAGLPLRGAKSLRAKLEQGREMAELSKRLCVAATDAPVEATLDDLRWEGADAAALDPLLERLGFSGVRGRIPRWRGSLSSG